MISRISSESTKKEVKNNAATYNFPISQLPKKVQAEIRLGQFCWGSRLVRYSARGPLLLVVWIGNYVGRNSWGHIIWITSGFKKVKVSPTTTHYCSTVRSLNYDSGHLYAELELLSRSKLS